MFIVVKLDPVFLICSPHVCQWKVSDGAFKFCGYELNKRSQLNMKIQGAPTLG